MSSSSMPQDVARSIDENPPAGTQTASTPGVNPFSEKSGLPFELPPFDEIAAEHYAPAFDAGMAQHRAEVDAIIANPEPPTVENTIVALERAGQLLNRTSIVFFNLTGTNSTPALRAIESEYAPKLTAHSDAIRLDPRLFARIDAVHSALGAGPDAVVPDTEDSVAEDEMLVRRYHLDFVLAGAALDDEGRARLAELNQRLSTLSTAFQQNLLQASEDAVLLLESSDELDGLSAEAVNTAADAAAARGHAGKFAITLILPSGQPQLKHLRNREVRRRLFEASTNRASAGDHDNRPLLVEMAQLRADRAALLGFDTHADAKVADQTVRTSAAIDEFLGRLVGPAMANADAEAAVLAELAARDGVELAPWDWAFYSERVRAERYDVDTAALRPYFDLERVLHDGVFFAASQLYGIETGAPARPRRLSPGRPGVGGARRRRQPDRVIPGRLLRQGGQARWRLDEQLRRPVVPDRVFSGGVQRAEPAATSRGRARTARTGRGSHVVPRVRPRAARLVLAGHLSAVVRHRCAARLRRVPEPGQRDVDPLAGGPGELRQALRHRASRSRRPSSMPFGPPNSGARVSAPPSISPRPCWIRPGTASRPDTVDHRRCRIRAGGAAGRPVSTHPLIPPRYRTTYFQHIFAGGYSAGYYSYIWSEVLDAETVEWFKENGGLRRENGDAFRDKLLSVGGSVDCHGGLPVGPRPGRPRSGRCCDGGAWTGQREAVRGIRHRESPASTLPGVTTLADYRHLASGKVRELYEVDDELLLMVASDRISAYDHILPNPIPDKGRVLTAMSVFWFELLDRPGAEPRRGVSTIRASRRGPRSGPAGAPAGDAAGRMRGPRLPDRLRPGRLPAHRSGVRHRVAGRPGGGLEVAGADLHPGHQGRARRARRERHLRCGGGSGRSASARSSCAR